MFRSVFSVNAIVPSPLEAIDAIQYLRFFNSKTGANRAVTSKTEKPKAGEKICIFM